MSVISVHDNNYFNPNNDLIFHSRLFHMADFLPTTAWQMGQVCSKFLVESRQKGIKQHPHQQLNTLYYKLSPRSYFSNPAKQRLPQRIQLRIDSETSTLVSI